MSNTCKNIETFVCHLIFEDEAQTLNPVLGTGSGNSAAEFLQWGCVGRDQSRHAGNVDAKVTGKKNRIWRIVCKFGIK